MTDATSKESMTAVTPGSAVLLALAARLVVASDILKRKPCEVVYLQQDCLAAAEALRLAAKPAEEGVREALKFYADAENYRSGDTHVNGMTRPVMQDRGNKARAALSTTEEPKHSGTSSIPSFPYVGTGGDRKP